MDDVRIQTSDLKSILKPFIYSLSEHETLFALQSQFMVFNKDGTELKLYIKNYVDNVELICKKCGIKHKGFAVLGEDRADNNELYLAFQPNEDCNCRDITLFKWNGRKV